MNYPEVKIRKWRGNTIPATVEKFASFSIPRFFIYGKGTLMATRRTLGVVEDALAPGQFYVVRICNICGCVVEEDLNQYRGTILTDVCWSRRLCRMQCFVLLENREQEECLDNDQ